jgi:3-phenylpropionate/trans-cinnamate dioxygenase subunit alpha
MGTGFGGFNTLIDQSLSPRATEWLDGWTERLVERVGHPIGSRTPVHGTIFSNFSLLRSRWTIRVCHPKGPNQMECWSSGVVPRSAPPVVRRELVLAYQQHFSPAGTWGQDDGEQWAYSARDEGFISSTVPLNTRWVPIGLQRESTVCPAKDTPYSVRSANVRSTDVGRN